MEEGAHKRDLEQRTERFAAEVRSWVRQIPRSIFVDDDVRQVIRASGSVGANYIEAQESLGKKDFVMHARICRKEAKESGYWLRLLAAAGDGPLSAGRAALIQEALELTKIFGAIVRKMEQP